MTALTDFMAESATCVEQILDEIVPKPDVEPRRLHEAMRWSLFAGGKRIRPAILFAAGQTFGAKPNEMLRIAAAIEMVHTYSLIHDDLPAMDDDDLRRGKATCHKQFDEATAILAGDVLQTLAFKAVADDEALSFETRVSLVSLLTGASGTPDGMVAGQQLDLEAEGVTLSVEALEQIHRRKTGALISASAVAGAMIGGASNRDIAAVKSYADKLGLIFQITDDLLDVTQATETLGKTAGKDAAAEKATYPALLGVERSRELASELCGEAGEYLVTINRDTALLRKLAESVVGRTR
ncbi:polyprenyl synthetase family protein [soil metagenome]